MIKAPKNTLVKPKTTKVDNTAAPFSTKPTTKSPKQSQMTMGIPKKQPVVK